MKKEDVIKILLELDEPIYTEKLDTDLTIGDMMLIGYTDSGARRALNNMVHVGKLIKLRAKEDGGSPINIYRRVDK